jgi:hypothetical protein
MLDAAFADFSPPTSFHCILFEQLLQAPFHRESALPSATYGSGWWGAKAKPVSNRYTVGTLGLSRDLSLGAGEGGPFAIVSPFYEVDKLFQFC